MLHLKRITNPYEWERDHVTGAYIQFGDYYYWDDEDDFVISAEEYGKLKKLKREVEFDYSKLNQAQNEREYEEIMKEKTRMHLAETIFNRKVGKGEF